MEPKSFTVKIEKNKNKRRILLLGSSHDKGIGPKLQENQGAKCGLCSTFKPNAPLARIVEDIG
jgi:hypothetical protein